MIVMLSNAVADLNTSNSPNFNLFVLTARYILAAALAVSWLVPAIGLVD